MTSFPDDDIDLLFEDIESEYSAYSHAVHLQVLVVRRTEELWTSSLREVTYQQNETRENLSDIAKGLKDKLEKAQKKLDDLLAAEALPAVAIGTLRKIPATRKEYPRS